MTEKLFIHKTPNAKKLISYGFSKNDDGYIYSCHILNDQMVLYVTVLKNGDVKTKLIDVLSNEEYILHLVKNAVGSFIGEVRSEYDRVLADISNNCFDNEIFKFDQSKRVISYFEAKYGNRLEHLWEDAIDNAIVRRSDTNKWYAAILTVSKRKLGLHSDERVEIIDLHASPADIPSLVDNFLIFPGFHMNKKHWITVILDGRMPDERLFELIDQSYILGKK